jgi:4-aminobutyrate aminotransferase
MIKLKTNIPGKKSLAILKRMKVMNGGYSDPLPFVHSGKGSGCYFKDIDGNTFLDFASQIAANPLGYNHKKLLKVVKRFRSFPVKYAGQDFTTKEHHDLLEELLSISKNKNAAFLINSGAEAVENAIKICMRKQPKAKFGISFEGAFHGRTIGALSCTNSKALYKRNYFQIPMRRLPFNESMKERFERLLHDEGDPQDVGFVIVEGLQGEGGYKVPSKKMMKELSSICHKNRIPLIADEIQSGMGRTGKWWAHEHYEFKPDVITSAKALQVGAVISTKEMFPQEPGSISSTWGGGQTLDLAIGLETIKIIKQKKLLQHNKKMGEYLRERLKELPVNNVRGFGLMTAFDVARPKTRNDVVLECIKNGLAILACGNQGIRVIPPYIVTEKQIDEGIKIISKAINKCQVKGFKHRGNVCEITGC